MSRMTVVLSRQVVVERKEVSNVNSKFNCCYTCLPKNKGSFWKGWFVIAYVLQCKTIFINLMMVFDVPKTVILQNSHEMFWVHQIPS